MNLISKFVFILLIMQIFFGCKIKDHKENTGNVPIADTVNNKIDPLPSICIWDKLSLRDSPSQKGEWLSSVNLGEEIMYLGESRKDSTNKNIEYIKIQLSDGKQGWASAYGIVIDALSGVLYKSSPIYQRPDLLTETNQNFNIMDMVAIQDVKDHWLYVIGNQRKKQGWIPAEHITTDRMNVAVAILANKALADAETVEDKIKTLENFLQNTPFSQSIFMATLEDKLDSLKRSKQK